MVAEAAGNLAGIGSAINGANAAAASTTQLLPAASDEASGATSALSGGYAQEYQALSAQMALFHDQFVQALTSGAGAATEAANASPLQTLEQDVLINAPTNLVLGRPLIGPVPKRHRAAGERTP
jgi:PE family